MSSASIVGLPTVARTITQRMKMFTVYGVFLIGIIFVPSCAAEQAAS